MGKQKTLTKRIRRLEARLQKDTKKLAKLKQKLGAGSGAKPAKKGHLTPIAKAKPAAAAKRAKRKLNISPERRAQLAAAMKARWAAKRAAAGNGQKSSAPANSPSGNA